MATADLFQENTQMFTPLPPLAQEAQRIIEPDAIQYPTARLSGSSCAVDAQGIETPYLYNIEIGFENEARRDAFTRSPTINEDITTIRKTVEAELQPVFETEAQRDINPAYADMNTDRETTIKTITPGTAGDIEFVAREGITPSMQQIFPDAGITDIRISDMRGLDKECNRSLGEPFAMNESPVDIQAPAQQQMAMSGGIRGGMGGPGF